MPKTAIVLFNLGGPDKRESIAPFLTNFFMDPNIIAAPLPVRFLLSRWIAFKRSRKEAGSSYAELGYKSPLLENTKEQATALAHELGNDYKIFIAMRYWHPLRVMSRVMSKPITLTELSSCRFTRNIQPLPPVPHFRNGSRKRPRLAFKNQRSLYATRLMMALSRPRPKTSQKATKR